MSYCPQCSNTPLKPIKLESNLPAKTCLKCHGCFVNLLSYRNWIESTHIEEAVSNTKLDITADDSKNAIICPNCSTLMQKFLIQSGVKNRVDICLKCDEAWLDQGEWQLLHQLGLNDKLTKITTEPWQIRVKKKTAHDAVEQGIKNKLGQENYQKVIEFKKWMQAHAQTQLIKSLLKR